MTYKLHKSDARGHVQNDWLDSKHTFSFGHFRDPERMGFRSLRVINEDVVIPGAGFDTHPHDNMEIITYVLDGALEHKDSMGTGSVIRPGEIQKMSAGTGITHSEFNHSNDNEVHLLQIWIVPSEHDIEPAYEQIPVDEAKAQDGFVLLGDRQGTGGAVTINQDAKLYAAKPKVGQTLRYDLGEARHAFVHLVRGRIDVNGQALEPGDGLEISNVGALDIKAESDAELLLFDLA